MLMQPPTDFGRDHDILPHWVTGSDGLMVLKPVMQHYTK